MTRLLLFLLLVLFFQPDAVLGQAALTCYVGTVFDLGPPPSLGTDNLCNFCMRTKVEITPGKAQSLIQGGLPGVGVTFYNCAKTIHFGIGVPIVDGVLLQISNYLEVANSKVLCMDSLTELRPKAGGRITICSCCSDLCNNNQTLCFSSNYTSLGSAVSALQNNPIVGPSIAAAPAVVNSALNFGNAIASFGSVFSAGNCHSPVPSFTMTSALLCLAISLFISSKTFY